MLCMKSFKDDDDISYEGVHPIFMLNSFNDRGIYSSMISNNTSSQNTSSEADSDLESGAPNFN